MRVPGAPPSTTVAMIKRRDGVSLGRPPLQARSLATGLPSQLSVSRVAQVAHVVHADHVADSLSAVVAGHVAH